MNIDLFSPMNHMAMSIDAEYAFSIKRHASSVFFVNISKIAPLNTNLVPSLSITENGFICSSSIYRMQCTVLKVSIVVI